VGRLIVSVPDSSGSSSHLLARVILGSAEAAIAGKFVEAAEVYAGHPRALQLRAMNIIYETTKERGATILMPSSMVDSLNPTAATLALALAANDPFAGQELPCRGRSARLFGLDSTIDNAAVALERSNRPSARAGDPCGDGSTQIMGK
jgi:hypothetical protein